MAAYLVVDKGRENAVSLFIRDFLSPALVVEEQITVGDFMICVKDPAGKIIVLASIERKTHADLAASICDGRYGNREKMRKLREASGCRLFYLIEGAAFVPPDRPVGKRGSRMKHGALQSTVDSLVIRDGVTMLYAPDAQASAELLARYVTSYDRHHRDNNIYNAPACAVEARGPSVPYAATQREDRSVADSAIAMWASLSGISLVTARVLYDRFSVADFICLRVDCVRSLKMPSGKAFGKAAGTALRNLIRGAADEERKLLAGTPGLGKATAEKLHRAVGGLAALCAMSAASLAEVRIPVARGPAAQPAAGVPARCLGVRAARILEILRASGAAEVAAPSAAEDLAEVAAPSAAEDLAELARAEQVRELARVEKVRELAAATDELFLAVSRGLSAALARALGAA